MSKQDTLPTDDQYALVAATVPEIDAPALPYMPPAIERDVRLAIIGCGGIASTHLAAYQSRGWKVVAFCDIDKNRAQSRAFSPWTTWMQSISPRIQDIDHH